jgi:hypothetical protein
VCVPGGAGAKERVGALIEKAGATVLPGAGGAKGVTVKAVAAKGSGG